MKILPNRANFVVVIDKLCYRNIMNVLTFRKPRYNKSKTCLY